MRVFYASNDEYTSVRSVTCWWDHKFYGDTSVGHDPRCWICRFDIFFLCFYIVAIGRLMLFIIGDRTVRLPTVRSVTCWRDHKFYGDTSVCHDPRCWSCRLDIFFLCFYIGANGQLMLFIGDRTVRLPSFSTVS